MIHVFTSDIGHLVYGTGKRVLAMDGDVLSECQPPRWKHAFYGMFSFGLIPMGYALLYQSRFGPVLTPDFWAASGRS